jgi:hypothetical protein
MKNFDFNNGIFSLVRDAGDPQTDGTGLLNISED